MKLSEAMRKGIEMTLPLKGELIEWAEDREDLYACALGAAFVGFYGAFEPKALGCICALFKEDFPISRVSVTFPERTKLGFLVDCTLSTAITILNDDKGWSRERIADWVESIEKDLA
jgi:hypothetical protein